MINIVCKNHTEIPKIERGMVDLPLWQVLGGPVNVCVPSTLNSCVFSNYP